MTQAIKARIRALLDKTVERGCTEAEAIAAAEKAARLMRDHGLSPADIVMDRAEASIRTRGGGIRDRLWSVIGHYTNCAPLIAVRQDGPTVTYTGRAPGPDIAAYLTVVCNRAIDRELQKFKAGAWYRRRRSDRTRRQAAAEFVDAMVHRLTLQLQTFFRGQHDKTAMAEAKAACDRSVRGTITYAKPKSVRLTGGEASRQGWAAGDVVLSHAVDRRAPASLPTGGRSP